MKKQKIDLSYFITNFDLKKFIKFLDKKFEESMTSKTIIIDELYKACCTKEIGYKKLIKEHNLSDFNYYDYTENGSLLPTISANFELEKESFKSFDDEDFEYFYSHHIISSKINKSYYLLVDRNVAHTDINGYYCRKKFKDKKKAILFLKEEQRQLKKDPR
jgi:hypothetical protein